MITFFTDRSLGKAFGRILRAKGISVEVHDDHLDPETPDEEVLRFATARRWVILTADYRVRYRPAEKEAILSAGATVIHVKPSTTWPNDKLAEHFAANVRRVERFLKKNPPPLFAVYRIDSKGKAKLARKTL